MQISIKSAPNGACIINIDHPNQGEPIASTLHSDTADTPLKIGSHHPTLNGKYAGIIVGEDGQPDHDLALLAEKPAKALTWEEAKTWAASLGNGARLPTKREAALLYANLHGEFETSDYYWTSTPYSGSDAWIQTFANGGQVNSLKSSKCLCRAVR